MGLSPYRRQRGVILFPGEICIGGRASRRPVDPGKMTGPGGALFATILFIPLGGGIQPRSRFGRGLRCRSSCAIARFALRIPSSVMAAAANRRTINTIIGSGFAAACAAGAARRSPSCRPFSSLRPLQLHRPQPGAAAPLPGRPSLGNAAPTVKDPDRVADPSTLRRWCQTLDSSRPPFSFLRARRSGLSAGGPPEQRFSCTIRCPCAGTPYSRFSPGSGPCGFRTLPPPPPSLPGKRAAFRLTSTPEAKTAPWPRIWSGSNSASRCWSILQRANWKSGRTGSRQEFVGRSPLHQETHPSF